MITLPRPLPGLLAALALVAATAPAQTIGPTDFVNTNIPVPASVLSDIGTLLPERSSAGAAFTSSVYSPNLLVLEPCTVDVTFVSEGAGYDNALGYFTYTINPLTIVDSQLVFPRLNDGLLASGDTVTLRDETGAVRAFAAGQRIGFFLVADGWDVEPEIQAWDALTASLPDLDPAVNILRAPGYGTYTTADDANPEVSIGRGDLARHTAMLVMDGVPGFLDGADFLLMAWEDLLRTSGDNDFNDAVFITQSTPVAALDTDDLPVGTVDDPDGDGVSGSDDAYPHDAERAAITSYPSYGWNGVGLEDLYPGLGDGDYNDTVLAYRFDVVSRADGQVKDVQATVHLLARGGVLEHRLGLHIPGLPGDATGTVAVERFLSDDAATHVVEPVGTIADMVAADRRLETLLPSSHAALPNVPGKFVINTLDESVDRPGASSRLLMTFDTPVDAGTLGLPPYDLYWMVFDGDTWADVHFAGVDGFADRDPILPAEVGGGAFIDDDGYPWMIDVPFTWRFPLETRFIGQAYSPFLSWASSHGLSDSDWYDSPNPARVGRPASEYLVLRDWTVTLPDP